MDKILLEEALETMNQRQAAEHFGVHLATVKRAIKRFEIKYKKKSGGCPLYRGNPLDPDLVLTKEQDDIMTGSLLGDGFVLKTNIFRIKQEYGRKEYVEYLHDMYSPFSTPVRKDKSRKPTRVNGKVSHKLEDWKGEYSISASFSTRYHKIFENLRNKWYPNGIKIVPEDIELNETVLTHWHLQDGYNNKEKNYYRFSTNSFTEEEVNKLSQMLNSTYNINSDVQKHSKKPVIMITKTNGRNVLTDIFRKNISFKCFQYKI